MFEKIRYTKQISIDPSGVGGETMKRLKSLNDVRRFLSAVTNDLNDDKITESRARTLGYLSSILQQVIQNSDLEARVEELEKELKAR